MFKVSVNFTVKMVIENVRRTTESDACKGWAVTEAVEIGGGNWAKVISILPEVVNCINAVQGSTIEYNSAKSDGKLKDMAWSTKRGDKLPPVWLVVHKV